MPAVNRRSAESGRFCQAPELSLPRLGRSLASGSNAHTLAQKKRAGMGHPGDLTECGRGSASPATQGLEYDD